MFQFAKKPKKPQEGERKRPWVDKYRPKVLDDVAHQQEAVDSIRQAISSGNLNHMLFYGPPGTGKTSTILAAANELYGPLRKKRILELNASDERGIKVVRDKVKQFAKSAVGTKKIEGYPCPPFKLIILDECDSMTSDAQNALRRTMEEYSKTTRFCLICNYVTKIIPPVASRCAKFRFRLLPTQAMTGKLKEICEAEKLDVSQDTCNALIDVANGDMRKCINLLQSARQLKQGDDPMTVEDVLAVSVYVKDDVIETILQACEPINNFDSVISCAEDLILDGQPISLIFEKLALRIASFDRITDYGKGQICLSLSKADTAINANGANEFLQFQKVLSVIQRVFRECPAEAMV